jgi:hypothetical protein
MRRADDDKDKDKLNAESSLLLQIRSSRRVLGVEEQLASSERYRDAVSLKFRPIRR